MEPPSHTLLVPRSPAAPCVGRGGATEVSLVPRTRNQKPGESRGGGGGGGGGGGAIKPSKIPAKVRTASCSAERCRRLCVEVLEICTSRSRVAKSPVVFYLCVALLWGSAFQPAADTKSSGSQTDRYLGYGARAQGVQIIKETHTHAHRRTRTWLGVCEDGHMLWADWLAPDTHFCWRAHRLTPMTPLPLPSLPPPSLSPCRVSSVSPVVMDVLCKDEGLGVPLPASVFL